jgi:chromosome segregation protein
MKLKNLEISGFKSFPDKARIAFPEGISAIVGPNGCGKSNIADALRWVMGEQSLKQLRGKTKEDVLFAGANGSAKVNMAEVSLTLVNDNGSAPEELKDFSEIMLTRRLYRSGESAYFLNKQPCRLKDIQNVFLGSGMGTKSYAFIQQGNVGTIIEAGPDERRHFLEEAAGVTRYKVRKKEALRKVEHTNQNLLRLKDILNELTRQMAALKRQARKAERFKQMRQVVRRLDICLNFFEHHAQGRKIDETDRLLRQLKDKDLSQTAQLRKIDTAIEQIRNQRTEKSQAIADNKAAHYECQRQLDRFENDLAHLRQDAAALHEEIEHLGGAQQDLAQKSQSMVTEIAEEKGRSKRLAQEIGTLNDAINQERTATQSQREQLAVQKQTLETEKNKLLELVAQEARCKNIFQNASDNQASLKRRLRRIDEEEALAGKRVDTLRRDHLAAENSMRALGEKRSALETQTEHQSTRLESLQQHLAEGVKRVQSIDLKRKQSRSELVTLEKMEASLEWYREGVRAIMTRDTGSGHTDSDTDDPASRYIKGLVADIIEPETEFVTAVEAVLGEALQYVIVEQQDDALDAIDFLQTRSAGRSGFIPFTQIRPMTCPEVKRPDKSKLLLNHVQVKDGFEPVVEAILGHVVVAGHLQEAVDLHNRNGKQQTIVTKDGQVITRKGILIGGSEQNLSGILVQKQQIKRLKKQIKALDHDHAKAEKALKSHQTEVMTAEKALQQHMERINELREEETRAEKKRYQLAEELKHAQRHFDITQLEQEQLMGEAYDLDEEIGRHHQTIEQLASEVTASQQNVARCSQNINALSASLERSNQKIVDLQLERTALNTRIDNSATTLRRLKEFHADSLTRKAQLEKDITAKKHKTEVIADTITSTQTHLDRSYKDIAIIEDKLKQEEAEYQRIDSQLGQHDLKIASLQSEREATLKKISLLEMELSQLKLKQEHVENKVAERYQASFSSLGGEFENEITALINSTPEDAAKETDRMAAKLTQLQIRAERMQDVNLGAIKEYDELKERFNFLEEQRMDLEKAIEDLHQVIRKINRISQKRFLKTFNAVNEKLAEVFPRLFEGGSAKLTFTEPNKPLETGVEFMIHPPGKKLTRVSLLSGGEKALSAIAFIFSIFLIKPAAFCLMDEIDAPLDEANIFRFNELLKVIGERSQVIMITHNKRSMEFADTLFGVTMEKKGVSKLVSVNFTRAAEAGLPNA